MAYTIRIQREKPISQDDWKKAVVSTEGVRLHASEYSAANPKTGVVVSIPGTEESAEICIDGTWYPGFHWFEGSISFKASTIADPESVLGRIARELASKLNARLVGDDGEEYQ